MVTAQLEIEMIDWLSDCIWGDMDASDFVELTAEELVHGINRHYSGGLTQFIKDGK